MSQRFGFGFAPILGAVLIVPLSQFKTHFGKIFVLGIFVSKYFHYLETSVQPTCTQIVGLLVPVVYYRKKNSRARVNR